MLKKYVPITIWVSSAALKVKAKENLEVFRLHDLLAVITNKEQLLAVIKNPAQMYKGPQGFNLAATMIQKTYRFFRAYSNFKQLKFLMKSATYIQRRYRLFQIKNNAKKKLVEIRAELKLAWVEMQAKF
jgi:hypothetical protein